MNQITISDKLNLQEFADILSGKCQMALSDAVTEQIDACYRFLEAFSKDKVIYGINTGFGPMAQWRIDDEKLRELQYNIIRSHSVGAGRPVHPLYVRAAMIARLATFLQARSGVHIQLVRLLVDFINLDICPMIPQHGSVGASGDLVQLAHIALALIGEGEVYYRGTWREAANVLAENGLKPFEIHIREGLSVTNGTSMMTGVGLVNLLQAKQLLRWSVITSVMMNEIASSYDDLMAEALNTAKRHRGQAEIARLMRQTAAGSRCIRKRETELFRPHTEKVFENKVQAYYSLRCVPQVLGPVWDEIANCEKILIDELNSACDNPIVDPQTRYIYHGGNFHGDYVSFEMDKLKIAVTKLTMLAERQMNYLFHDRINGILPPFVNLGQLGLNYGMQAAQFTATSTTAECQTLSTPMCIHSIPNNNDNQDVVSMGTNAAQLAAQVVENSFQVMAIHVMAIVQAVDCLKIQEKLSPFTGAIYNEVRAFFPVFIEDTPKYKEIRTMVEFLKNKELTL